MSLFLELLKNGFVLGILYALFAYGLTIILAITHIWHFGYAASVTIAGFALWYAHAELGLPVVLAIIVATIVAGATSVAMEWGVYAPLRRVGATQAMLLVASLAMVSLVSGLLLIAFGTVPKSAFPGSTVNQPMSGLPSIITKWDLIVVVSGVVLVVLLVLLMNRSRLGAMLRAVGNNPGRAESLGVSRTKAYRIAFGLGGAITVAPATLLALRQPVSVEGGLDLLSLAIVAIILGGIGNAMGALVGGIVVGVTQAVVAFWLPSVWTTLVLYVLLFIGMLIRPGKAIQPILDN